MPRRDPQTFAPDAPLADTSARANPRSVLVNAANLRRRNRKLLADLRQQIGELQTKRDRLTTQYRRRDPVVDRLHALRTRYGLTGREIEVALLLADGRRNAAIATALGISPHTARHHTQHVLAKLGVHSRAEAGARLRGVSRDRAR